MTLRQWRFLLSLDAGLVALTRPWVSSGEAAAYCAWQPDVRLNWNSATKVDAPG